MYHLKKYIYLVIDNEKVREREREVATNALSCTKNGINKELIGTENHICKFRRNFKRNSVSF